MRQIYRRIGKRIKSASGVSMIELIVSMVIAMIVMLGVGGVLVHQQMAWNRMYNRVHDGLIADGYISKMSFDGVVRKSSLSARTPQVGAGGDDLNVYYYSEWSSDEPDRYGRFYSLGGVLFVDYGQLDADGSLLEADHTERLADNVSSVDFSVIGPCVEMVLDMDDGNDSMTVVCSATRHNE